MKKQKQQFNSTKCFLSFILTQPPDKKHFHNSNIFLFLFLLLLFQHNLLIQHLHQLLSNWLSGRQKRSEKSSSKLMKGYHSFESGGVIRIEGMDVGVMTINRGGDWSLDSGDEVLVAGWERMGVGDNCEVASLISGDDACRFLVKNRMLGRDFAFLMILWMADMEWYWINGSVWCWFETKMPVHHQDQEIPRNWEEPNDPKSRSSTECHLITSPIPSPSSTSVPVA